MTETQKIAGNADAQPALETRIENNAPLVGENQHPMNKTGGAYDNASGKFIHDLTAELHQLAAEDASVWNTRKQIGNLEYGFVATVDQFRGQAQQNVANVSGELARCNAGIGAINRKQQFRAELINAVEGDPRSTASDLLTAKYQKQDMATDASALVNILDQRKRLEDNLAIHRQAYDLFSSITPKAHVINEAEEEKAFADISRACKWHVHVLIEELYLKQITLAEAEIRLDKLFGEVK